MFIPVLDDTPFSSGDFIDKLVPNLWSFLINLLALIVLFVALYFIAYKPVKRFVKARKDYIEGNIRDAEKGKEEMDKALRKKDSILEEAKKEGAEIVASSKEAALKRAKTILETAEEEAKRKKDEADLDIAKAKKKAEGEMREAILSVSVATAEKALERHVNEEEDRRLRKEVEKELEKHASR